MKRLVLLAAALYGATATVAIGGMVILSRWFAESIAIDREEDLW